MQLPKSLRIVINELAKLPGIGPRSAQRLGLYLLKRNQIDISLLADAIQGVKSTVKLCAICHTMTDNDPCGICTDDSRDHTLVCVVEEPLDAIAIERSNGFKGLFHVLGGVLNPLEGIGPEQLEIRSLAQRVQKHLTDDKKTIKEIILATNPTLEGETTARHIARLIQEINQGIKITRIARGIPTGGDLEYADDLTLSRALSGRNEY